MRATPSDSPDSVIEAAEPAMLPEAERRAVPGQRRRWVTSGFWAVLDQGLFATTNFALSVLMARWLDPEAFGAFSIAYSVYLLLATLHTALLTEPMLVFGPAMPSRERGPYLRTLMQVHVMISAILTVLLGVVWLTAWMLGHVATARAFGGLSLSGSFILLLWLARRNCYMRLEPRAAAIGGMAYLTLTIILAGVLRQLAYLNEFTVFVLMGIVALAVAWLLLRGQTGGAPTPGEASLVERFRSHIDYARWAVPTSALTWAPANLPYLVLPIWGGLSTSADFRALTTLVMPMLQTNYALGQMFLPGFSRHRGQPVLTRTVRTAYVGTVGLALMFWVAIAVAGPPLLEWLYGGKYTGVSAQIIVIGALPVLTGIVTVQQALIRARQQPRLVFWAYASAAFSSIAIGTPLTYWFGLRGAIAGVLVSYGVLAAILWRVSSINEDQGRADEGS